MIKACLAPRCPEPATYRGRCQRHSKQRERITHSNKAVYNSKRWQVLRKRRLFLNSLCQAQGCMEIATDVDHIVPIERGGAPFDLANTQSMCHSCHSVKTRWEQMVR